MRKLIKCRRCGRDFVAQLPDVSAEEAARLRAANDDRGLCIRCPRCTENALNRHRLRDLPDLPEPP
jgi:hypothetical protein